MSLETQELVAAIKAQTEVMTKLLETNTHMIAIMTECVAILADGEQVVNELDTGSMSSSQHGSRITNR